MKLNLRKESPEGGIIEVKVDGKAVTIKLAGEMSQGLVRAAISDLVWEHEQTHKKLAKARARK